MRIKLILSVMTTAVMVLAVGPTRGAIIITVGQDGSNVVAFGSGSVDLTGLTLSSPILVGPYMNPKFGDIVLGSAASADLYSGATGPAFGTSLTIEGATTGSGSAFGFNATSAGGVVLPLAYTSGLPISGTALWTNSTISSLGLTPGTYQETWGGGGLDHTITVQIYPSTTMIPEPSSAILGTFGAVSLLLAHGWSRHRREQPRQAAA